MTHRKIFAGHSSQEGAALITSIFALLLITVLGMALMAVGEVARTISTNDRENTEALYIADSGIAHARKLIFGYTGNYDSILTAGDGTANTGDELSTVLFTSPITAASAGGRPFGFGSYVVWVTDDDDEIGPAQNRNVDLNGRIIVRSTGTGRNGSTATVEVIINAFPLPALVVDGNLRISGNPDITGAAGGAHANGNLNLNGNPRAQEFFATSGTLSISGVPRTGAPPTYNDSPPDTRPGEPPVPVPQLNPADFRSQADYILGADGRVRNQAGTVIGDATGGSWDDWSWDSGGSRWVAGNDISSGTYYAEGSSINISGNPGSGPPGVPPLTLSLIADGYVDISGNPTILPDIAYAVIAGTDLKISGNPSNAYTGTFYAGHQIDFSGNPTINGQVLAKNLADTPYPNPGGTNLVMLQSGYMTVSGNPTINWDGLGGASVSRIVSWQEVRN